MQRVALWDNARFLVLFTVVVGHAIESVRDEGAAAFGLYTVIYAFHMPALFVISGYFSRADWSRKTLRGVLQLAAAYLIWITLFSVFRLLTRGIEPSPNLFVEPWWVMWFLLSLITMKLLLPLITSLRYPLVWVTAAALLAGFVPAIDAEFSASRTFAFLPFFVAGYLAKQKGWLSGTWFQQPSRVLQLGSAIALAGATLLMAAAYSPDGFRLRRWFTGKYGYENLMDPDGSSRITLLPEHVVEAGGAAFALNSMLAYALLMILSATLVLAFLLAVPREGSFMTTMGTRTMYIYLLHAPIIWLLEKAGLITGFYAQFGIWALAALIAGSLALTLLLASRPVAFVFRPLVEPQIDWMMSHDPSRRKEPR